MSDLMYYTCEVVGWLRGRMSIAEISGELHVYESGSGLSQTAYELIENTIAQYSGIGQYAPYVAQEAKRVMLKWRLSGWTNFTGDGYTLDDEPEITRRRSQERDEFAKRIGLGRKYNS
jgi:hypothetical protein